MTSALQFVIEHPFGLTPGVRCRLGAAELTALVKLRDFSLGDERAAVLSLVGGARIPTGAHELAAETGARREEHLQPGTGAWSGVLGADLLLPLRVGRIDLNASYRKNGVNSVRYGYGDVFLYNAGFARRLGNVLELSLQANGRSTRRDDTDGISLEHSCGSVLYASPAARLFTSVGVVLEAGAQFPVSSALHGEQEEHATLRFALSLARYRSQGTRKHKKTWHDLGDFAGTPAEGRVARGCATCPFACLGGNWSRIDRRAPLKSAPGSGPRSAGVRCSLRPNFDIASPNPLEHRLPNAIELCHAPVLDPPRLGHRPRARQFAAPGGRMPGSGGRRA